ncbi:hypothetical protein D3C81_1005000 [compost metagenome]
MQEVPLQMLADEIHLGAQQLQQVEAIVTGGEQLIEFAQAFIQQAGGFTDVSLGQVGDPALEVAWRCFAKRQTRLRRGRGAQGGVGTRLTHALTGSGGGRGNAQNSSSCGLFRWVASDFLTAGLLAGCHFPSPTSLSGVRSETHGCTACRQPRAGLPKLQGDEVHV